MKQILLLVGMLFLSFLFTSCDPGFYLYDYDELITGAVQIDLINYENPNQKHFTSWVPNHTADLIDIEIGAITVLETLSKEKIESFSLQLSKEDILFKYYAYNSPNGLANWIIFENGDFDIINCNVKKQTYAGYIGTFTSDGKVKNFIGCFSDYDSFVNLVNTFFTTKIE